MTPIDKDLIDKSILNKNEKIWLNNYQSKVYKSLNKFMVKSEILDLKEACSAI